MKGFLKVISAVLVATMIYLTIMGCGKSDGSDIDTQSTESAVSTDVVEYSEEDAQIELLTAIVTTLQNMYECFNAGDYEGYVSYYDIKDEEKAALLSTLEANSALFRKTMKVDHVSYPEDDNGSIMTTITAITTSENISSGSSTVLKEKIKYIMRWNDDRSGMKIVTYVTGGSEIISIED